MNKKTKTAAEIKKMLAKSIDCSHELKKIEESLEKMPILKGLLTKYVFQMNEEYADSSTSALVHEYLILKNSKSLHLLFVAEYFENTMLNIGSEWL
jgi:hypothetical protein